MSRTHGDFPDLALVHFSFVLSVSSSPGRRGCTSARAWCLLPGWADRCSVAWTHTLSVRGKKACRTEAGRGERQHGDRGRGATAAPNRRTTRTSPGKWRQSRRCKSFTLGDQEKKSKVNRVRGSKAVRCKGDH